MTDLEHDLASAADRIPMSLGDAEMVMAKGRHRRARKQRIVSGVTAVAVVASLAAMVNLNKEGATPVATTPALQRGDAGLQWEVQSTASGLGYGNGVGGSGPFYALSTAPGRADVNKARPSRVVYRSDDGVEWSVASTLGKDLYLSDLAPSDTRVYAVGTAPAQAGAKRRGDVVAGWSDDNGKTFSKTALPIDWASIESRSTSVALLDTQIASTNKGTVVTAIVQAALDVPRLLPNGVTAPDGWATTATGVDILGPAKDDTPCPAGYTTDKSVLERRAGEGASAKVATMEDRESQLPRQREVEPGWCFSENGDGNGVSVSPQDMRGVVRSLSFADLGVTGDARIAASKQLFGFFAEKDSTDFARIDLGDARSDVTYLDADDAGFNLFASGITYGSSPAGSVDMHSVDGQHWTSTAGPGDIGWVNAAGTVGGTRVVIGETQTGAAVARSDGNGGWDVTPLSSVVEGGRPVHVGAAGVGPLGVVMAGYLEPEKGDEGVTKTVLAFSRDGSTWESKTADDLAGKTVGMPLRVFVTGQRAVVAFSGGYAGENNDPKPQTILVATPA